jgi:hypothetical protein
MRWPIILLSLLLVGCGANAKLEKAAKLGLDGNKLGSDFLAASETDQLAYCVASMKAYKTSGVQSFSVSPSVGNLTPKVFCGQLAEYIAEDPGNKDERLSQASATAILLYSRPKNRRQKTDAELDRMQSSPK